MINENQVCLYDGFKIRNYEPSYFDYIVNNAEDFNLILSYQIDSRELSLPISSTYLGCNSSEANDKQGFKVVLKMVSKNNVMKRCVEISGSFHKFYNKWNHNADDFFVKNFNKIFWEIRAIFALPLETTEVCNLEVGLNLTLPINYKAKELCSSILFIKGKSKTETETRKNRNEKGYSYYTENSILKKKIYSKSDQYKTIVNDKEVIRIEFKFIKRREIERSLSIKNFGDLTNMMFHEKAINYFIKNTQGLIFYQKEMESLIPNSKANQIFKYRDPNFWEVLWKKSKEEFYTTKNNYFYYINLYAKNNITDYIKDRVILKSKNL